jgi:hypothetical protein
MYKSKINKDFRYLGFERWENMIEKRYIESILKNEKIERLKKYNLEVWILSSKQKYEKRKITKETKKSYLEATIGECLFTFRMTRERCQVNY